MNFNGICPVLMTREWRGPAIDRESISIDNLSIEATRAIDLLKERRTALISAAVTGKIDVRSQVAQEAA